MFESCRAHFALRPRRRSAFGADETLRVAEVPEGLTLRRHRDLVSRRGHIWVRRGLLGLIAVVLVLALLNVFGQRPSTVSATAPEAKLSLYAPTHLRSGLFFEARFHINASAEIKNAILVLGSGWLEGITVNTIEPSPVGEASRNGKIALTLGHIPATHSYILFIQSQINPTNVGRRSQNVWLYDGDRLLAKLDRTVTIFP